MTVDWVTNEPTRGFGSLRLRELWARRELAVLFARRDFKVRYRQTVFGVLWALLEPLVGAAALVLVFGTLAGVAPGEVPHLPFAVVGFAAWSYFASAANGASQSLVAHSDLVTKVYFPRLLLPLGALLPGLVDLAIGLSLGLALGLLAGLSPGPAVALLPMWVVLLVAATAGLGVSFGALNVRFRDVRYVFSMVTQVLFFLTPIAYSEDLVTGGWAVLYGLNPFAGIVSGLRWSLLGVGGPQSWWLASLGSTLVLVVVAVVVFQRGERRFADII